MQLLRITDKLQGFSQAAACEAGGDDLLPFAVGYINPAQELTGDLFLVRSLSQQALQVIPERAACYAARIGVRYGRITIRLQKTRWGSCSSKGNLNFNCLLMLAPPEALDSVVVHELCHLKELNHSARFYSEVLRVFPDYRKWQKWLKENGDLIMARAFP